MWDDELNDDEEEKIDNSVGPSDGDLDDDLTIEDADDDMDIESNTDDLI